MTANELEGPAADAKWTTVFQDEIYYGQDGGDFFAGVVAPAADANGLVFSDRYILPFFMMTVNIFMAVGAALEPDYHIKFRDAMRRYTARLQKTHDISKDGIVDMRRPTSEEILNGLWMLDWYHLFGQGFGDFRLTHQPYGVIHTYSGYRSVSFYPQLPFFTPHLGTDLNPAEAQQVVEVNVKLNFVVRRERVKTYVAIGLQDLHNTINDLRRLTGDAPMPSTQKIPRGSAGRSMSGPSPNAGPMIQGRHVEVFICGYIS
jgi:hypothetical protein